LTAKHNDVDSIFICNSPAARVNGNTAADNDDDGVDAEGCVGCFPEVEMKRLI
jgi:hypothetical protein